MGRLKPTVSVITCPNDGHALTEDKTMWYCSRCGYEYKSLSHLLDEFVKHDRKLKVRQERRKRMQSRQPVQIKKGRVPKRLPPERHLAHQIGLSYDKEYLVDLIKRHRGNKNCKCTCPFTGNSIVAAIQFVCAETDLPAGVRNAAIGIANSILATGCFAGSMPRSIAAAIIWVACLREGKDKEHIQEKIAAYFFTTPVTVRNRTKDIVNLLQ